MCIRDSYGANLSDANLSDAILRGANLSNVLLRQTILDRIDLRTVHGLSTIKYQGPSIIALHTVQLPEDGSALLFLRGCGVPEEWIDDYRARMMHPIQYYSVFISYSTQDELLAKRLHADLQDHGVRCWFAPHDLKPGDFFRKKIDQAIQQQDRLLLILSEHSVHSKWVEYEVDRALDREISQQRTILFPLRIDDAIKHSDSQWAEDLRSRRHIGDFTRWSEPELYQEQLKTLLAHLKPEAE